MLTLPRGRRRLPLAVVVLAFLGLVGALALGVPGRDSGRARAGETPPNSPALQRFSIFVDPAIARPSADDSRALARVDPAVTLDPATARVVSDRDGNRISVIGGPDHICLTVRSPAGGGADCAPAEHAADPRFPMGEVGYIDVAGGWRVLFLFPDGVRGVSLRLDDGEVRALDIVHNVVSVLTRAQPQQLSYTASDGSSQRLDLSKIQ